MLNKGLELGRIALLVVAFALQRMSSLSSRLGSAWTKTMRSFLARFFFLPIVDACHRTLDTAICLDGPTLRIMVEQAGVDQLLSEAEIE